METKVQISEKDKKLLVFLGIFVIVVCFGYWGIRPAIKSVIEINANIQDERDQQELNEMKISELIFLQGDNEDLENNIVSARESYFPIMTSDEIDRYFTDMVLERGIYSYDLGITMPEKTCTLEPYKYSAKMLEEDVSSGSSTGSSGSDDTDDSEDSEDSDDEESKYDDTVDNGIYAATVTMKLGGEQKDLTKLVDDLSNTDEKLRVKNYSYTTAQTIQNGEDDAYEVVETQVLNITVELYMCQE